MRLCFAAGLLLAALRCHSASVPHFTYQVVHVYPHDPAAFTQGLEFHDGFLYEGTGLNGRSTVMKEELQSGHVLQQIPLDPKYFGEGITLVASRLIQLTWLSHTGFIYDRKTFSPTGQFSYKGEGWGLANDGSNIYMSDGTADIRVLDSRTLRELRRFTVHDGPEEIKMLNELEWVKGELLANVWQTDNIVRIDPSSGAVTGWIDLSHLLPTADQENTDVLNGIAYDAVGDRLFVTGKLWPKLFEIRLIPAHEPKTTPRS